MNGSNYLERVTGTVQKVGIAKCDVAGAIQRLLAYVGQNNVGRHDEEAPVVERHDRAVAAFV